MTGADRRLLSLVLLSAAVLANFGQISGAALGLLFLSLVLATHSLVVPTTVGPPLPAVARPAIAVIFALTMLLYRDRLPNALVAVMAAAGVVAIVLFTVSQSRLVRIAAGVLGGGAQVAGAVTSMTWGSANIDVFQFQQKAAAALLGGHNPYGPVVPSPEILTPGLYSWIPLHLPYGPILPLLEAPIRLLGDVRVLHVLCALLTAAAVLALARRAGTVGISACVLIAFPLTLGMIVDSWVDIITMAGFAVWLVFHRSHPRIATIALALALGVKPTTLIALVPIFFWSIRARRQVIIAGILAAAVVLPFALATGVSQFYYNVLGVQLTVLPRLDSLTLNSYLHLVGLPLLPAFLSVAIVGIATLLVLRRRPQTYGQLLTGTAILVTVSFLVAKWAYFNYYYIPAVLLVMAVAGDGLALDAPEMIRPPALLTSAVDGLRRRWPRLGRPVAEPAG